MHLELLYEFPRNSSCVDFYSQLVTQALLKYSYVEVNISISVEFVIFRSSDHLVPKICAEILQNFAYFG